jgi:hypothetical protein
MKAAPDTQRAMRASHVHPLMRGIVMHAIGNSRGMKTLATALVAATFGLGAAGNARAQSTGFGSYAYSIKGVAEETVLGLSKSTETFGPDDQSVTTTSGSNAKDAANINESHYGVTDYQSEDDENSTDVDPSANQANAASSSGSGNALGGVVSWSNFSIQETCNQDGSIPGQLDCTTYDTISNLLINGVAAGKAGSFAPGTSIPISADIPDDECDLGYDSFEGELVLGNSAINSGTEQGSSTEIAMEITGTATCYDAGIIPIYTVEYDEQIGVPAISYLANSPMYIVKTSYNKLAY